MTKELIQEFSQLHAEPDWLFQLRQQAFDKIDQLELPRIERVKFHRWNLGDSRIYQISSEGKLGQLSLDHVLGGGRFGKPPLTQYLGIPEESMGLEPTIVPQKAEIGTRYLICSDGITDMLSDGEIADILTREISVSETVELLVERALIKGGRDNITVILCELVEQEKSLFGKLLNYFL